jgi:hypothetical protein
MPLTRNDLATDLENKPKRIAIPFTPCADVLLSLVTTKTPYGAGDDVQQAFMDYFAFTAHEPELVKQLPGLDSDLAKGLAGQKYFPPVSCWPSPLVTLQGQRHRQNPATPPPPMPDPTGPGFGTLRRLFVGDVVWLYFMERMGLFRILGALLDDYALKGTLPIEMVQGEHTHVVLEVFTRQVKMGVSPGVRDRDNLYRKVLGWTSEAGRSLGSDAQVNRDFASGFTAFMSGVLKYYSEKRLAVAIQASAAAGRPSVATLTEIGDLGDKLRRTYEGFLYGRNYLNTLSSIVYAVGAMALVGALRDAIGIPKALSEPHEYLGAAYDILVTKERPGKSANRFIIHREMAKNARDILMQLEVANLSTDVSASGTSPLQEWLDLAEGKFESFRTNYRVATGSDLGAAGTATMEQVA